MSELTLIGCEPSSVERGIGKEGVGAERDDTGGGTLIRQHWSVETGKKYTYLDDEEPLPSCEAELAVELEDTGSDHASESGSENVTGVENGDTGGDLCSGVEVGDDEEGSGVCLSVGNSGKCRSLTHSKEPQGHRGRIG